MRLTRDMLFLALFAALAGWAARAPAGPEERAAYLCAPVAAVADAAVRVQIALEADENIAPPFGRAHFDAGGSCRRRLAAAFGSPGAAR